MLTKVAWPETRVVLPAKNARTAGMVSFMVDVLLRNAGWLRKSLVFLRTKRPVFIGEHESNSALGLIESRGINILSNL